MQEEEGRLYFDARIGNDSLRKDAEETKSIIRGIGTSSEEVGRYSDEALNRATNSVYNGTRRMADAVRETQNKARQEVAETTDKVEAQMDRLQRAFQQGYNLDGLVDDSISGIKKQITAIKEYINEVEAQYKKLKSTNVAPGRDWADKQKKLVELKREINENKAIVDGFQKKLDELSSNTLVSFRTQIQQTVNQLAAMRIKGEQNTEQYKELERQLAKLATIQREVRNNMTSDSTGATQWTGIIQGVQGLMGAYSVGAGVIGMFVKDQEKLMQVQTKMQSVMGILMGMQQIANTLHSTSTFRLRTLTKAQELYTLAVNKTKTALLSGSAAAKTFKIALASTGVGLLAVAIGALVSAIAKMRDKAREASKEMEAFKASLDVKYAGGGEVAKATAEINAYVGVLEKANLTKAEEKRVIDELNGKYGSIIGKYQDKAAWLDALKTKTENYIGSLRLQAQAETAVKQAMEAADKEDEANKKVAEVTARNQPLINKNKADFDYFKDQGNGLLAANLAKQNEKLQSEIDQAATELEEAKRKKEEAFKAFEDVQAQVIATGADLSGGSAAAENLKKQLDEIDRIRTAGLRTINANEIALMQEGKAKKLAAIERERTDMLAAIDKEEKDLDKKLKEAGKGGLTRQDKESFTVRRTQVNEIQDVKRTEVEENASEEIAKMYRELGDVFATEEQRKLDSIKRRYEEQRKQLKKQKEGGTISEELYIDLSANVDRAEAKETADYWIAAYGSYAQQRKALDEQWQKNLATVPAEYLEQATRQMKEAMAALDFEQFKKTINWGGVFGDLDKQASSSIQYNLSQIQSYFDANKANMGVDEIKDIQQAIAAMTDELDKRNPFAGLLSAMAAVKSAKTETVEAIQAVKDVETELAAAEEERRLAQEEFDLLNSVDAEGDEATVQAQIDAQERLAAAEAGVAQAENKKIAAQKKAVTAGNSLSGAYRKMTSQMQSVKGAVSGIATDAKNLAAVFSDDVADGMEKAIDLMDTVIDATTNVINAVANTGKTVADSVAGTVQASSAAMQATSMAAATSIKTVEKASVILTVISAALQVATAIASLFDGDKKKDEQIESLQSRIDQLQWEIDNSDLMNAESDAGVSGIEAVNKALFETEKEFIRAGQSAIDWKATMKTDTVVHNQEAVAAAADKVAEAYAGVAYSAGKAYGNNYYNKAAEEAKKYAEQQVLLREQLAQEEGKKKKDDGKIEELKQEISEKGGEILEVYREVMEDIIGGSEQDIADRLGDAFFEAFQQGEDAARAWGDAVNDIVADVIKRMFIQQFITKNIADVFDKYQKQWFKDDGSFVGWETFAQTMADFGNDLNGVSEFAVEAFENMPDEVKKYFTTDATREATQKGIASISQDSADEMNGRMTAIQGHTYSINENVKLLVSFTQNILYAVVEIQDNTERIYRYLSGVESDLRDLKKTTVDMQSRGVKFSAMR